MVDSQGESIPAFVPAELVGERLLRTIQARDLCSIDGDQASVSADSGMCEGQSSVQLQPQFPLQRSRMLHIVLGRTWRFHRYFLVAMNCSRLIDLDSDRYQLVETLARRVQPDCFNGIKMSWNQARSKQNSLPVPAPDPRQPIGCFTTLKVHRLGQTGADSAPASQLTGWRKQMEVWPSPTDPGRCAEAQFDSPCGSWWFPGGFPRTSPGFPVEEMTF